MLVVGTITVIQLAYFIHKKSIKEICRDPEMGDITIRGGAFEVDQHKLVLKRGRFDGFHAVSITVL